MEEENLYSDLSSSSTIEEEEEEEGKESWHSAPQTNKEDASKLEHGCEHYRRRCKIRAPCCDKIFCCRHCHNDAMSLLKNPNDHHELVRPDDEQVVRSLCDTEQQVKMGEYFCHICKFYDDDTGKGPFHCGGRDKFFHCKKCGMRSKYSLHMMSTGSCCTVSARDNHICIENSMKNYCPVCYEIEANKLSEEFQSFCNDCNSTSKAPFHIFGHKCRKCNSYNTRRILTPGDEGNVNG